MWKRNANVIVFFIFVTVLALWGMQNNSFHQGSVHACTGECYENWKQATGGVTVLAAAQAAARATATPAELGESAYAGCIACHGGEGEAQDKASAHQGLMADMSAGEPEKCLICHEDLPDEIPGDRLKVPHGALVEGVEQGKDCGVYCSDCHGGVGHGFDPVSGEMHCSMTVCLDCHQEMDLEIQMANCDACHIGPHDVAISLTCDDCHASTDTWRQVDSGIHDVALPGKHGLTACFECHQYPDFKGLNNICSDCHESGHTAWGEGDCAQCHDPGGTWDMTAATWEGHVDHWDQYKGQHAELACAGCHFESYDLDPACTTCHRTPEGHSEGRAESDCTACHQADEPWTQ